MEYERSLDGQIQAAMAQRAGKVLLQYESMSKALPPEEQFEATLAVALLQMMLTNCWELINRNGLAKRGMHELNALKSQSVLDDPAKMGLEPECIVQSWPSMRGLTYREIFECLRNSLSHPGQQGGSCWPVTGFTTCNPSSDVIDVYEFTQSPWVNSAGNLSENKDRESATRKMANFASNHQVNGLTVSCNDRQRWQVLLHEETFVPVLRLRLNVRQLRTLALTLSDLLSESLATVAVEQLG